MSRSIHLPVVALLCLAAATAHGQLTWKPTSSINGRDRAAGVPSTDWKRHNVGRMGLVVSNVGLIGGDGFYTIRDKHGTELIGLEYPIGSNVVFLSGIGLWFGAVAGGDTLTTTGYEPANEWFPTDSPGDTIVVRSNLRSSPFYHPEAISEQDMISHYEDDFWPVANHTPLRLSVIQKSFAWSISYLADFVFMDYAIISKNPIPLRDVFVGFWADADVGYYAPSYVPAFGDIARFDKDRIMGIMLDADGDDGLSTGRVGLRILQIPPTDHLKLTFGWSPALVRLPWTGKENPDKAVYETLSSGQIMPDQLPAEASDTRFFFGFGPFSMQQGDTLKFVLAIIAGPDDDRLAKNSDRAKALFDADFVPPYVPPPSPPLKATASPGRIKLNWIWEPGDAGTSPEEFVDPKSGIKDFEGYRLYKGVVDPQTPSREPQDYVLLGQYDLIDGIGYDTGLQSEYEDSGLLNGIPYYYAVTSYDQGDTINSVEPLESSLRQNLVRAFPGSPPATSAKLDVAVVPNPYLGNANYTRPARWEDFEGDGWLEQDRRIQFINLPPKCTIRIYTLDGDLVKVLEHDDPTRGYADWNLVSEANQAISSDIYLFTVASEYGNQVGKFVVLK